MTSKIKVLGYLLLQDLSEQEERMVLNFYDCVGTI